MQRDLGLPETTVTAILADNFVDEVNAAFSLSGEYAQERVGGEAIGKTVSLVADESAAAVIFDGTLWHRSGSPDVEAFHLGILAHELAHPVLNHARAASGTIHVVPAEPTPDEVLSDLARGLADEYRADCLADLSVGVVATMAVDGHQRPYHAWAMDANARLASVVEVLGAAKETWTGEVERFHRGELSGTALWMSVASSLYDALVPVIHAQAYADSAKAGVDILSLPEIAHLPAVRDCIAEPVGTLLTLLREHPILASLAETRTIEEEISRVGTEMLREILASLGITSAVGADGATVIRVGLGPA
jgi:hypothetical protein